MRIIIPGPPIAKMRPKFRICGKFPQTYDPQSQLAFSAKKDLVFRKNEYFHFNAHLVNDFEASLRLPKVVKLWYHQPIAISDSKAKKKSKLEGLITSSKDIDNLIKWTLDICNGILWHDDAQIVEIFALKKFSEKPCTILEVSTIKKSTRSKNERNRSFFCFCHILRGICRSLRSKKG